MNIKILEIAFKITLFYGTSFFSFILIMSSRYIAEQANIVKMLILKLIFLLKKFSKKVTIVVVDNN